jgi:hypothetical protein
MYLEIQNASTGEVISTTFLPDTYDVYTVDVWRDPDTGDLVSPGYGDLIAVAGERIWSISDVKIKGAIDANGIPWVLLYLRHETRDYNDGIAGYDQICVIQAPTDNVIRNWTYTMIWDPGYELHPSGWDWNSVVITQGGLYWNAYDYNDSSWKVFKKAI